MRKSLADLHRERGQLTERIAAQRLALRTQIAPVRSALQLGDRLAELVRGGTDYAKQHPFAMAAAVLAVVLLKPRGTLRWVRRGFVLWRSWRSLRQWATLTLQQQWARFRP